MYGVWTTWVYIIGPENGATRGFPPFPAIQPWHQRSDFCHTLGKTYQAGTSECLHFWGNVITEEINFTAKDCGVMII